MICCQAWSQGKSIADYEKIVNQNKKDTNEVIARIDLFRLTFRTDIEEARAHIDKGMKLSRELNYQRGIASCYRQYSVVYNSLGDYEKGLEMLKKSRAIFGKLNDRKGESLCDNMEAVIHYNQGNYEKALELYIKGEKYHKSTGNRDGEARAKYNIHLVHFDMKDYNKALTYLNESFEIYKELSDSASIAEVYSSLGSLFFAKKKYRKAIEVMRDGLDLAERMNNVYRKGQICNNIGVQYAYLGDLDSAKMYYQRAITNHKIIQSNADIALLYSNLGNLEVRLENGTQAKAYYDSSLMLARQLNDLPAVASAYIGLSISDSLLNNHLEAREWYKKYHFLNDSLTGERVKNNINELTIKYDAGKKDLKIASLEKSRLEAEVKEEKNRQLIITIVASALMVVTILFFIFSVRNARVKEKANALEQKVFRAQMNPHFIFNSLNSIQRMYVEGKEEIANDYMADFSRLLRSILENSGKQQIPLKEELELTMRYLDMEKLRTKGLFEYCIDLSDDIDPMLTKVPPLIFQPYIENAIWHGIIPKNEEGYIGLSIRKNNTNTQLVCEIDDNGVGFDPEKNQNNQEEKTSQGMAITAERLGGEQNVTVSNLEEGGTRVTIKIDYKS